MIRLNPEFEGKPEGENRSSIEMVVKNAHSFLKRFCTPPDFSIEIPNAEGGNDFSVTLGADDVIEIHIKEKARTYTLTSNGELNAKDFSQNSEGEDILPDYMEFAFVLNEIKKELAD